MYILSHPHTLELFSFKILHSDLVQVKKDGQPYREEQWHVPHDERNGMYSSRIARKIWEALTSQGFEKQ